MLNMVKLATDTCHRDRQACHRDRQASLTRSPSRRPSRAAKHCWMRSGWQMVVAVALMGL